MNNQQQVDKKRHGSKIMRSKSLNVTATSLIFPFSRNSGASIKREKEREWHAYKWRKRERSIKEKRMEFFFSATAIEIESSKGIGPVREIENDKRVGNRKFNRFSC
jgi:hypothetical protein